MSELKQMYETKPADYFTQVRREVLPLLPVVANRVLDVGCGEGDTLAYLKQTGRCSITCGVEVVAEVAERARTKLDEVYQGSVETMDLPLDPGSCDVILCLDVLEHLVNPWLVVKRLHSLLSPTGVMIASIPNVRHFTVITPLVLFGKWEYEQWGLLDKTHLRFFTRQSAIALMESSGLTVDEVKLTGFSSGKARVLNLLSCSLLQPFLTVQFLIRARNSG